MNTYIGQVVLGTHWIPFCIKADSIYDAEAYVKTVPSEGGRCTSLALSYDESVMVKKDVADRIVMKVGRLCDQGRWA